MNEEKQLPYAPETERMVLSAIMVNPAQYTYAAAKGITAGSFHDYKFRTIWEAMAAIDAAGKKIDVGALLAQMPDHPDFIADVSGKIATDYAFPEWIERLLEFQAARRAIQGAERLRIDANPANRPPDAAALAEQCETLAQEISGIIARNKETPLNVTAENLKKRIGKKECEIPLFPERTEGADKVHLHPGEIMTIAAGTGFGKTALAAGFAWEAVRAGKAVLYCCIESSAEDILARIAAQMSGVPHYIATSDRITEEQEQKFRRALDVLENYSDRLFICGCDAGSQTADTIKAELKRAALKAGHVDLLIVDFIQGVQPPEEFRRQSVYEQVAQTFTRLHKAMQDEKCAAVVLSQVNRAGMFGENSEPNLSWLKDSSKLEELSHAVAFLYRTKQDDEISSFRTLKTRNMIPFNIALQFNGTGYRSRPVFAAEDDPR